MKKLYEVVSSDIRYACTQTHRCVSAPHRIVSIEHVPTHKRYTLFCEGKGLGTSVRHAIRDKFDNKNGLISVVTGKLSLESLIDLQRGVDYVLYISARDLRRYSFDLSCLRH